MNIGLDWDDTFTRDPDSWCKFINMMQKAGHSVYIVTWRNAEEAKEIVYYFMEYNVKLTGIYATDRKAKMSYMFAQGICIDVVIDDNPSSWTQDMVTYSPSGLWQ